MRHYYVRLILGVVFVVCAVFSLFTANLPFALLYVALGGAYLSSASMIRKDHRDDRR